MDAIFNILNHYIDSHNSISTQNKIAQVLLNNLNTLSLKKLSDIAQEAHVSPASVIRFCQEIGYSDFTHFRKIVENNKICVNKTQKNMKLQAHIDNNTIDISTWLNTLYDLGNDVIAHFDHDSAKRIAKDIYNYKYVYIFGEGHSGLLADYLRMQLGYNKKIVHSRTSLNYDNPLSSQLNNTLGIIISQHGRTIETSPKLLSYLKENCNKVWIVTQENLDILLDYNLLIVPFESNGTIEFQIMITVMELITKYYDLISKDIINS